MIHLHCSSGSCVSVLHPGQVELFSESAPRCLISSGDEDFCLLVLVSTADSHTVLTGLYPKAYISSLKHYQSPSSVVERLLRAVEL